MTTLRPLTVAMLLVPSMVVAQSRDPGWTMHHIHDDYIIANSLQAGDVNQDGFDDYSVIDERLGLQTIIFHPGPNGDVRKPWSRVVLGQTGNPEYSCLGDLDGDGNLDLVVVEGDDLERGYSTGVRIWWGPTPDKVADPAAWTDAGHIPGSGGHQYLYCLVSDLNLDGRPDILVGGRRHKTTKAFAGIRWLTGPAEGPRRELNRWQMHFIDPDALSGHGLVIADVNEDGRPDVLVANADWDTPKFDQDVAWYENPADPDAVTRPWTKHFIWKIATKYYPKPQIAVGDLDGDGHDDLATQTQNFVEVFRKDMADPADYFTKTNIQKPDWVQWVGRPIKIADLDGDGKPEIIAGLIHLDGLLPADKASVFMMKQVGDPFDKDGWSFHPIKWSDGYNSRAQWIGEKWDHLLVTDVDGDGDADIVGNVEEHFRRGPDGQPQSFFSVVWFENPLK